MPSLSAKYGVVIIGGGHNAAKKVLQEIMDGK